MSTVIICEKPDVMRKVADALGLNKKGENEFYYTNNDESIYSTSVRGHYLEILSTAEMKYGENTTEKDKWTMEELPIVPKEFPTKPIKDTQARAKLKTIVSLCKKCDTIVNCGDADREGQVIVDEILIKYGFLNTKNVKRLWLPAQTEEDIINGFKNLPDNESYSSLRNEGFARQYMDWLFGINITRLLSLKVGKLLNSGRLIIPIVKYIYDRDMAIKNFVPVPYFIVKNNENVPLITKEKWRNKNEAINQMNELNKIGIANVENIKEKDDIVKCNKLFSMNTLQTYMSSFGVSPQETLDTAQKLYEKGYTTYPRTDTEYLKETEKDNCKKVIEKHKNRVGKSIVFKDTKDVFNSAKVNADIKKAEKKNKGKEQADTSHSAITPTELIPNSLTDKLEKQVYDVICNRFYANFCEEDAIVTTKKMVIKVGDYEFNISGKAIKQEGHFYFEKKVKEAMLPNYNIGDSFDVKFNVEDKKTTPPPKVSVVELFNFFEKPFKKIKLKSELDTETNDDEDIETNGNDDEDYKLMLQGLQLGTTATRSETVKKCVEKVGYISETKKSTGIIYSITDLGIFFIETLEKLNVNLFAEKTIEFSKILTQVKNDELTIDEAKEITADELEKIIENAKTVEVEKMENTKNEKKPFGELKCCDNLPIYKVEFNNKEGKKLTLFTSDNEEKPFKLYQETKLFGTPVKISDANIKKLLKGEGVAFKLTSNRTGKDYEGIVSIVGINGKDEQYTGSPKFKLDFPSKK